MFHENLSRAKQLALTLLFAPLAAQAQEPADSPPATGDESGLETIVVTGVAAAGGVKKLEASYNIVTANEEEIRRANPKSTADLLKISPGMWPEATGGQTGANIEIAGFPGGGDAPYFTTQLMGSPLYGMPTLSFFETTSIFRLDDTVKSVEILQGGPSVVFAGGQMGATSSAPITYDRFSFTNPTCSALGAVGCAAARAKPSGNVAKPQWRSVQAPHSSASSAGSPMPSGQGR